MKSFKNIDYKRVGYHILFWLILTIFFDSVSSYTSHDSLWKTLQDDLIYYFPFDLFGAYFTLYFLFPRYLYTKKYLRFAIYFIIFFAILVIVFAIPVQYLYIIGKYKDLYIENSKLPPTFQEFFTKNFIWVVALKLMIIGLVSSIKLLKVWLKSQKQQQLLEKENLEIQLKLRESELKFLKSQINPHFLFNTLNNLYSLTLSKSDKAPDVVIKISSVLSYVLYECNVPFVELEKEIKNVNNYIELQKLRYGKETIINIEQKGDIQNIKIAPLLILPLIENAFKHGLDRDAGKGRIDITINTSEDKKFSFEISNNINSENIYEKGGIGLKNLKRRLQLQYADKHQFKIKKSNEKFKVAMILNL